MGSGEEFKLQYVLVPFKYVLGQFWSWAGGGFNIRGALLSLPLMADALKPNVARSDVAALCREVSTLKLQIK